MSDNQEDPELIEAKVYKKSRDYHPSLFEKRRLTEAEYQRWLRGVYERELLRRFSPNGKPN